MGIERGFMLAAEDGEHLHFSDAHAVIRASAETTGGAFCLIEEIDPLDTPLHVHEREDELFYVLDGEHIVQVGDEEFELGPGDLAYGPPRRASRATPGGAEDGPDPDHVLTGRLRGVLPRARPSRRAGRLRARVGEVRDYLALAS